MTVYGTIYDERSALLPRITPYFTPFSTRFLYSSLILGVD